LSTAAALWLTIVALGLYHGLNPAMGWPLAVANGMTDRRTSSLLTTMLPLGGGHLAAMVIVLAPFAVLGWYMEWSRAIRLGSGAAVLLFGLFRLIRQRHPRMLARIPPTRLALWSFAMATAHGAGLMLVPFMLGLCATPPVVPSAEAASHAAVMAYMARSNVGTALLVATVHSVATLLAGVCMALLVYRFLGLGFLRRAWLDLDRVWGASLVLAGAAGMALAV
jgi:hypothetical protein